MLKKEREVAAKLRADQLEQQRIALQRMAPNRKWVRPNKLALPEELEPAVNLESKELKQQHLRTKRLMEMHYISAQDVPPSPAEPPEAAQPPATGHAKTIPLEDVAEGPNKREEGEFVPGPPEPSPKSSQPPFTGGLGRGPQLQASGPPGPPPGPPPRAPLTGGGGSGPQPDLDQLPAALKDLDPSVLRILVENEHLVRNLMQDDGSLNEEALVQLVTSLQPPTAQNQGQVSQNQQHPIQPQGASQPPMIQQGGMAGGPPPPPGPPHPLPHNQRSASKVDARCPPSPPTPNGSNAPTDAAWTTQHGAPGLPTRSSAYDDGWPTASHGPHDAPISSTPTSWHDGDESRNANATQRASSHEWTLVFPTRHV